MVRYELKPTPAFSNPQDLARPGFSLKHRDDLTIAHICVASGKRQIANAAMQGAYLGTLPTKPERVVLRGGLEIIWAGVDQWLAVAPRDGGRDLDVELKSVLHGLAAVTDQSDARAVVRMSGERVRDLLAKGVPVDLDPRVFPANGVAITHASHIGVLLWQIGSQQTFDIAVFRSFADSLHRWIEHSLQGWAADCVTGESTSL